MENIIVDNIYFTRDHAKAVITKITNHELFPIEGFVIRYHYSNRSLTHERRLWTKDGKSFTGRNNINDLIA